MWRLDKQMSNFYAHSSDSTDRADWQLLSEHLSSVGRLAEQNAAFFDGKSLAQVAGLLHDLGKYTDEFQRRLSGDYGKVDHSTWGARIACERYGPLGKLLAYGIAGHHAGLANGREPGERTALNDRLRAQLPTLLPVYGDELLLPTEGSLTPPASSSQPRAQSVSVGLSRADDFFLLGGCRPDTEAYYHKIEQRKALRGGAQTELDRATCATGCLPCNL